MTETEIKAKIEKLRKNKFIPEALKAKQIEKLEAQLAGSSKSGPPPVKEGAYSGGEGFVVFYTHDGAMRERYFDKHEDAKEFSDRMEGSIDNYKPLKKKRGRQADPVKKAERRRKSHINSTITYKGKPIDDLKEDECRQLIKDLDERRESQAKSAKKSRSTPVVEKVLNNVVRAAKQAMKAVPAADIKDSPTLEIKKMKALAKLVQKFMIKVKALLGDDYDKEEVDAGLKEVRDVIKELEKKYK